jgi:hypothetical protein
MVVMLAKSILAAALQLNGSSSSVLEKYVKEDIPGTGLKSCVIRRASQMPKKPRCMGALARRSSKCELCPGAGKGGGRGSRKDSGSVL